MEKYNSETGYMQIVDAFNRTNNVEEKVRKKLFDAQLIQDEAGEISTAIEALAKRVEIQMFDKKFPRAHVTEYLVQVKNFVNLFNEFNRYREQNNFFEVSKQRAVREAERNDQWKLWRDKLVRWVAGIFIAVLLYSTLVALTESSWFSWLKIPLRDYLFK